MNWKIGQKLVCIRVDFSCTKIKKGEIYTYNGLRRDSPVGEYTYVMLREIDPDYGFVIDAFRPVDDTFGEVVAEIIEKQLELETVEA